MLDPEFLFRAPYGDVLGRACLPRALPVSADTRHAGGRDRLPRPVRQGGGPRTGLQAGSRATRTRGRAGQGADPTDARDARPDRGEGREQAALLRGGRRAVVRLGRGPYPHPAWRGAHRGLPLRSQRQAAFPVGRPRRGARCTLWTISSVAFAFYLANFANIGFAYGSIGAAVGLLLYLYLCAAVVLLGAELNAAIYHPVNDETSSKRS